MSEEEIKLFYKNIGLNIKSLRKRNRLKQDDLAKELGLSRTSIVNIESGNQRPNLHFIYILALKYGASIDELIPSPMDFFDKEKEMIQADMDRLALDSIIAKLD